MRYRMSEGMANIGEVLKEAMERTPRPKEPEQEPVALRHSFDGYGYLYTDMGFGSGWIEWTKRSHKDAEPLYTAPPQHALMAEHWKAEYDKLKAACKPLTDKQLRKLWARYASKMNGWPNDSEPPMVDIGNGPRFQVAWHESEYHIFRAGFEASRGIKE